MLTKSYARNLFGTSIMSKMGVKIIIIVHQSDFWYAVLIKSNAQLIHEFFVDPLQLVGQIWKRSTIGGEYCMHPIFLGGI